MWYSGIDLAMNVLQAHETDEPGKPTLRKQPKGHQVILCKNGTFVGLTWRLLAVLLTGPVNARAWDTISS